MPVAVSGNGLELTDATGLTYLDDADFARLLVGPAGDAREEGGKLMKILARPAIGWMVVALSTLQIHAQQQPPDVASQCRIVHRVLPVILQPLAEEEGRRPRLLVLRIGRKHLTHHHVPRFVLVERRS